MRKLSVFVTFCLCASANATSYNGTLSYSPPAPPGANDGLYVEGVPTQWPTYNVSLSWTVTNEDISHPGFPWKYTYTFGHDGNAGALSHVIIEASPSFTSADMDGLTGATLSSVGLQRVSSGNEGMPEDLNGIRFNPPTDSQYSMSWTFWSDRQPVWGDFYGRCGNKQNLGVNRAFNQNGSLGFVDPNGSDTLMDDVDPTAPAANNSLDYHILVPDSLVPEPVTALSLGLGALLLRRRRR